MISINRAFVEQTTFDSATPTGSAVVVHRFEQAGQYDINVTQGDTVIDRLRLNVSAQPLGEQEQARATAEQAHPGAAVFVDLTSIAFNPAAARVLAVPAGGYVAFSAPAGAGRLGATAARGGAEGGGVEFDSRRLQPGDFFAVTLIRPGRYSARNTTTGATLDIQVTYPVIGPTPYRPPDPANIECKADGFDAGPLTLAPAQGIIFRISTETRIQIELTEPDDGPSPATRPLTSWRQTPREPGGTASS